MYYLIGKTFVSVKPIVTETFSLLHFLSADDVQKLILLAMCSIEKCKKHT